MITHPHIPALRRGTAYTSLDKVDVIDHRNGAKLIEVSQVNAGIIRRDLPKFAASRAALHAFSSERLLELCKKAGQLFMEGSLPLGDCTLHGPEDYIKNLSASSGLPHNMVRQNMKKVNHVFVEMRTVLKGLTRGLDPSVLDEGAYEKEGALSFYPLTNALGVVLPSNSPGVNSLWMPAIALKIPVVLKPGREEPWTPHRIVQAFIAAGIPAEAFGFYPTDHEGASEIINSCGRSLLFGDEGTTARWANNPGVQIHGPGRSKILIGDDCIENWRDYLDVIINAIAANGGRSCVNASALVVPKYAKEIADALAKRLGPIEGRPAGDEKAALSGFANVKMAAWINESIDEGLKTPGASDVTALYRNGPRQQIVEGGTYMRPTIIHCESFEHPLANKEFLFPFASVVEVPENEMLAKIGHSLVVTAITENKEFIEKLLASPLIDRLNIGPISTTQVAWDQPHEGNLFEFLYRQRAMLAAPARKPAAGPAASAAPSKIAAPVIPGKFEYHSHTRIVFGENQIDRVGELAREYGGKRVLLVTDAGIVKAGHAGRAKDAIAKAGLFVAIFDRVQENPTTKNVAECVAVAQQNDIDFIVGLGGGSSMDTAKGANFIVTNGGKMADYWGINKAARPMLPMIAIPTTAGTGSECQSFALIADEVNHQKMACGDDKAYARVALLDPLLTLSLPPRVSANTGIDTIAHAVESHVTTARTPVSQLFSREAWKLSACSLETVLKEPFHAQARAGMLLASAHGGVAIAQSMLGAAHSAANPLTARFNVVHGQAVGLMLPHVVRFNSQDRQALEGYADLACAAGLARKDDDPTHALEALLDRLQKLLIAASMPMTLGDCGIPPESIPEMAEEAAKQWTAKFNPRPLTPEDFRALYIAASQPPSISTNSAQRPPSATRV